MVLSKVALKTQGSARSVLVNRFHSPVFKLFESGQDEATLPILEEAYSVIL